MRGETTGMFLIGITIFLWSTIEVTTKLINTSLPPLTIGFLRFFIGGAFLLPVVLLYSRRVNWSLVSLHDWVKLLLLSFIGITGTFSLYHIALYWMDASSVAAIVSMVPLFVAPLSHFFLKERIGPVAVTGLVIGAVGVLIIYVSEQEVGTSLLIFGIMILAVLCFSIYAVFMKPLNRKMDPRVSTPISLFAGAMMMIPFLLIDGSPLVREMSPLHWLYMMFLSLVAVGIAYLLYFIGLDRVRLTKGNSLMYLKPIIAAFLAWGILSEAPSLIRIIAIVIITVSVYMVIMEKSIGKLLRGLTGKGNKGKNLR